MPRKPFLIHLLPIGIIILSLIIFSQILTQAAAAAAAAEEQSDIELKEDKAIKQELGSSKTKPTNEENNTVKQAEKEEEESNNGDTRERGLEQNITINDIYPSDDGDVPFVLPFHITLPFP
jgi:hypothetical protein